MSAAIWSMRHQGSPQSRDRLTAEEILEGLQDELWEPTDEVRGPKDTQWQSLETHPHFAATVADYEPSPMSEPADESRLDMNPLIDVALVLLVFFILTATYESIRKVLEMPPVPPETEQIKKVAKGEVDRSMIRVTANVVNGEPVIQVEDTPVPPEQLTDHLSRKLRSSRRTQLLVTAQGVPWKTIVTILDAARGAGVERVLFNRSKKSDASES